MGCSPSARGPQNVAPGEGPRRQRIMGMWDEDGRMEEVEVVWHEDGRMEVLTSKQRKFDRQSSVPSSGQGIKVLNLPEANRTYSSFDLKASELDSSEAWTALASIDLGLDAIDEAVDEWMQIDLGLVQDVSGVRIQKRADDKNEHVTQVEVEVSEDGDTWLPTAEAPFDLSYGPDDNSDVIFSELVRARFVKIKVKQWNVHISMRAGVLIPSGPPVLLGRVRGGQQTAEPIETAPKKEKFDPSKMVWGPDGELMAA